MVDLFLYSGIDDVYPLLLLRSSDWGFQQLQGYDTSLNYFSHKNDFYSQSNMQTCCEGDRSTIDFWRTNKGASDVNGSDYSEFLYQTELLNIIESHNPADPLFLFYAPHVAHCPLQVPKEYYDKFDFMTDDEGLCSIQTVQDEHPIDPNHLDLKYRCRRQHAAMIMIMDEVVGNLTNALQKKASIKSNKALVA